MKCHDLVLGNIFELSQICINIIAIWFFDIGHETAKSFVLQWYVYDCKSLKTQDLKGTFRRTKISLQQRTKEM